nr:KICSTOR complex protein kaptin isoform X2 [Parasteatoda tepidariorum]
MVSMIEAHFYGIPHQSSIYGLTSLFAGESSHKVLVASSKRKVYCIEYTKSKQSVIFSTREVQFTYIPSRAEIISIDAFNQACHIHDFVVGITFTKLDNGGKQSQYFNIYSDWEPSNECDLDNIAQGCLSICLDFIPFHLTHTELSVNQSKEMVWLLSGSDCKIHLYREDKTRQTYSEEPSNTCFPEFEDLPSLVMWMDFIASDDSRITALGCKDGTVIVSLIEFVPDIHIVSSWKIQHDGPISSVKLFKDSGLKNRLASAHSDAIDEKGKINLVVGNTLEVSVVYRDVLNCDLSISSQWQLPNSNKFDCVTCALIADIDMDGNNELLLGTYGQHDMKKAAELCLSRMKILLQKMSREELESCLKLES